VLTISIDPVAVAIGPFEIRWYGIMVALAVTVLLLSTLREARRLNITHDIYSLFLYGIVGGFILSRLVHVIDYLVTHPGEHIEILNFSGMALYGAIGGGVLGAWVYTRVKKIPWSSLADMGDAIAVGAPLAQAIGRIGCTINGCCFGKPSPFQTFPGAIFYTPRDTIPPEYWEVPLYPAQIYFFLWNLIVFAILWRFRYSIKPKGSLFLLYLCLYAGGDFGLRFFRVNEPFLWIFHQGQVISLLVLLVATPLLITKRRHHKKQAAAIR
jgi:phosphatidylglycerol:prolipoprotein diacylglycerol transferase